MLDAVIVGAGPAGLSAALLLGRCRRRVLVCDEGRPRNSVSHALHGYLTRDGIAPAEFLRLGREQLAPYDTVELRNLSVTDARRVDGGFEVDLEDGSRVTSRKLLLATGVTDRLPEVPGIGAFYGTSVFHCPYCDGWEFRDRPIAILGRGDRGKGLAIELTAWSRRLFLLTDGPSELDAADLELLRQQGITLHEDRIEGLDGANGWLARVRLEGGSSVACEAMFFSTGSRQRSDLPARLGCAFTPKGAVDTGEYEATNVPGLYVAGDASKLMQLVIVAASEGAQAAFAINQALLAEGLRS